ncbi:dipeptide ABC transporter ATP-binding protein [Kutzneria sp. CA-103260]|uniref:dipeptide ABC transporter ATP-binding protein n=1 Tax=Kutzneria sp. CA-103260 TaxID=2802641 RepID=UPI001BA4D79B|nr:ABC transporter ATP-binding protein [Kutzneria sp. CA-103260]QUQ68277.1 ABC transporter ATP-binding protein [Kutzneria sp. CA-103260]
MNAPVDGPVMAVRDLEVAFPSEAGRVSAVRGIDLDVYPGRTLGIVGESGSGKSVTAMAIMGLLPDYAAVSGSIILGGRELLGLDDTRMSKVRGREIGMVFQDPLSSLTPIFSVGTQIVEALRVHQDMGKHAAWERATELMDLVGIPNARARARSFPHEFSGGMRQRVVIAIAIANSPRLIIADEPTTALDVTVQAQILDVLRLAQAETGAALILVTHDLGVVAGIADEVMVMYAGKAVETASADELFAEPRMPYTIGLLGAVPRIDVTERRPLVPITGTPPSMLNLPAGCPFRLRCPLATSRCAQDEPELMAVPTAIVGAHSSACVRAHAIIGGLIDDAEIYPRSPFPTVPVVVPREQRAAVLELTNVHKTFPLFKGTILKRRVGSVHAVAGVDLDVREGESVGLVGESGCGKTSTLLEIMNLRPPEHGSIRVAGVDVAEIRGRAQKRDVRHTLQMVFQDPMGALDPRLTVADILAEPLTAMGERDQRVIGERVEELMALVGLDPAHSDRFPAAFSGGQRQRIGIARALATNPALVVLDEPVSALDVSIQAGVLNLLNDLKATLGLSYLFVAHDLAVVRHICDRVAVMYLGRIVEIGSVDDLFDSPQHPYTQALLSAVPVPDPKVERARERMILRDEPPSPTDSLPGCGFAPRCPLRPTLSCAERARCTGEIPRLTGDGVSDHLNACHFR